MNQKKHMTTTNVRIPSLDLQEYRTLAAELGVSFNHLVQLSLKIVTSNSELLINLNRQKSKKSIWKLQEYSTPFIPSEEAEWSQDDKAVYDI